MHFSGIFPNTIHLCMETPIYWHGLAFSYEESPTHHSHHPSNFPWEKPWEIGADRRRARSPPSLWYLVVVATSDGNPETNNAFREKKTNHHDWLVVGPPLWKILVNWDDDIPNIWENKKWQPNHQRVMIFLAQVVQGVSFFLVETPGWESGTQMWTWQLPSYEPT